jgi:tRNA-Thr(GGU) m(6)t(6)A37 methyltransferase TsaA
MTQKTHHNILRYIGIIHTPHQKMIGIPIQPFIAKGVLGEVEIFTQFREALSDLAGFERIWLIYWCHRAKEFELRIIPYKDAVPRGLFATRAPSRPNPIGISAVRLLMLNEEAGGLKVPDVDMLDGTPLLDIKPYVPSFDSYTEAKAGWLDTTQSKTEHADDRFSRSENNL